MRAKLRWFPNPWERTYHHHRSGGYPSEPKVSRQYGRWGSNPYQQWVSRARVDWSAYWNDWIWIEWNDRWVAALKWTTCEKWGRHGIMILVIRYRAIEIDYMNCNGAYWTHDCQNLKKDISVKPISHGCRVVAISSYQGWRFLPDTEAIDSCHLRRCLSLISKPSQWWSIVWKD